MTRRNPSTSTLLLVAAGLFLVWRHRQHVAAIAAAGPLPLSNTPPPSYAGWPSAFGGAYATAGSPCTTSNGQPGTWQRVRFGAVQVGGIPQQWVCWPRGVPLPP